MNHWALTTAEYQRALDAAFADEAFVARVTAAAQSIRERGYGVVEECVNDPALLAWAHTRFWEHLGHAAPKGSLFHGRTSPLTAPAAGLKLTRDWPANRHGILEDGPLAHLDCVLALRMHPRVLAAFALLYGAERGMVVAMDRMNYQLPPEWMPRLPRVPGDPALLRAQDPLLTPDQGTWLHHDQAFTKLGLHCVQGLVTVVPADQAGDATLEVVPYSHLEHATLEQRLGLQLTPQQRREDWYKLTDADKAALALPLGELTQVRCGAGALVTWDSRLWHQGGRIRASPALPRLLIRARMVAYVCAQPAGAGGLTQAQVTRKRELLEKQRCTSHWPLRNKAFGPPRTYGRDDFAVFAWQGVREHAPGTAGEELYGLTAQQTLRYSVGAPLLTFTPAAAQQGGKRKRV